MGLSNVTGASSILQPGVCTSSTRPASPFDGQVIYETDTDKVAVYDSSAWVYKTNATAPTAPVDPGLVFIARTTFTAATELAMTNVFSSTYENYLVQVTNLIATGPSGEARVRLGTSGSADTGSNYDYGYISADNGVVTDVQYLNNTHWKMLASYVGDTQPSQMNIVLSSPNLARTATCTATNFGNMNVYLHVGTFAGALVTNTQYTDLFLETNLDPGVTHTCTITVYGYANSQGFMTTPQIIIHDAITGETITRDFNAAELAQLELDKAEAETQTKAKAKAQVERQVAREALLTRLGITEEEAQLLLGGN